MSPKGTHAKYTIAIDFDGVLHDNTADVAFDSDIVTGAPIPGALDAIRAYLKTYEVAVYSCRFGYVSGRRPVVDWLRAYGADDIVDHSGFRLSSEKPTALVYIDDRGYRFEGTFPTAEEIAEMRPWNKPKPKPKPKSKKEGENG